MLPIVIRAIFLVFYLQLAISIFSCTEPNTSPSKDQSVTEPLTEPESETLVPTHEDHTHEHGNRNRTTGKMPAVLYTSNNHSLAKMEYWSNVDVNQQGLIASTESPQIQLMPVAASADHLGLITGSSKHFIKYVDQFGSATMIVYNPPSGARFMKPSIDTMLICHGLAKLFHDDAATEQFRTAIDVGTGSGFIANYISNKLPGLSSVIAIDIDPKSKEFIDSNDGYKAKSVTAVTGDAITYLNSHHNFNLVVSNPPYVPTEEEVRSGIKYQPSDPNFWQGTGLMSFLIEDVLPQLSRGAHVVMVVPSLSLKSQYFFAAINKHLSNGGKAKILLEQEVAYKAWFIGGGTTHLLASSLESATRHDFGSGLKMFIGLTNPGHSRLQTVNDGRLLAPIYHWQVIYIVDFYR